MKPKWSSLLLLLGTLVLVGGSVLAATLPASKGPRSSAEHGAASAKIVARSFQAPPAVPVLSTITYKVLRGDSLPSVARWFATHGYGVLFSINEPVLRSHAHSLEAGERITIANGVMSVASSQGADAEGGSA